MKENRSYSESQNLLSEIDIIDRTSEILFGLIMVLTFTGSLSAATAGREDIKEMLIGAIGCNLAWGLIDALFYLMRVVTERGRGEYLISKLRRSKNADSKNDILSEALPLWLDLTLTPSNRRDITNAIINGALDSRPRGINFSDIRAAFFIFALVFFTTLPVALPFFFLNQPHIAIRTSNWIAVALLFVCGYILGRYAQKNALLWGFAMAVIGTALVLITIALGG